MFPLSTQKNTVIITSCLHTFPVLQWRSLLYSEGFLCVWSENWLSLACLLSPPCITKVSNAVFKKLSKGIFKWIFFNVIFGIHRGSGNRNLVDTMTQPVLRGLLQIKVQIQSYNECSSIRVRWERKYLCFTRYCIIHDMQATVWASISEANEYNSTPWILQIFRNPKLRTILPALHFKMFCAKFPCHITVLVKIINTLL